MSIDGFIDDRPVSQLGGMRWPQCKNSKEPRLDSKLPA